VIRAGGSVPDRLLGILGAVMVLAAVIVLIRGGASDTSAPATPPPPIQISAPAQGAVLDGPFAIVFRVPGVALEQRAGEWGLAGMHLHILVDGGSFMPAPADITPLQDGSYRWTFQALDPGEHQIRLFWSDAMHQPLRGGGSDAVTVEAR
jgi:hypothetical protein